MSDEVPFCWCNADPSQVRTKKVPPPNLPSLHARFMKSYDWPDPRDRRDYRVPVLPSVWESDQIHEACPRRTQIRQRGQHWWLTEQIKLEDKINRESLVPEIGAFYCFLEEKHLAGYTEDRKPHRGTDPSKPPVILVVRYGNVFQYDEDTGYHWITRTAVFPEGHPDGLRAPYQSINMDYRE